MDQQLPSQSLGHEPLDFGRAFAIATVLNLALVAAQVVYGILANYEDQNDAATLHGDPIFKLVVGRRPEVPQGKWTEG